MPYTYIYIIGTRCGGYITLGGQVRAEGTTFGVGCSRGEGRRMISLALLPLDLLGDYFIS